MRPFGALNPTDQIPVMPDTMGAAIVSSALAVVALDYPAGAHLIALSGEMDFVVNYFSTGVNIPTTNSGGTTASSGLNEMNPTIRQIPGGSTGYSLTARTSGVVTTAFWRK